MDFPKDPVILLSFVNTQLRDHYSSLSELANTTGVDADTIIKKLSSIGYEYDSSVNQFK